MPILHIHGLQDRGVPAGGNTRYAPADAGFALFRRANGCRPGRPRIARLPGGASRTDWPGCRAASPMTKILLDEGHRLSPDMLETALDWFKEIGAAY